MKKNRDFLKPVIIVVILLVGALIVLNIGSRIFFSKSRINGYLEKSALPNTNLDVNFSKIQLSFSGSLAPFFAIKMSDISIHYKECGIDLSFKAPYILIPFSMKKALDNNLRLGYVKAGKSELVIKDSIDPCPDNADAESTLIAKLKERQPENLSEEENFKAFFKKAKSIFKRVSGFRVQKLDFVDQRLNKEKTVSFSNIRALYNRDTQAIYSYSELNFKPNQFDIPGFKSKKEIDVKIIIDLTEEEGLALNASARHLEGTLEISSKPQKTLNNYVSHAKVKDLPLTFLSYFIGPKSLEAINSHRIWFNSEVEFLASNLFKKQDANVVAKFNNLEIFGPVLKSYASNFKVQVYPKYEIPQEIDWRLDSLNLNGFISQKNLTKISGVIDQLGVIRGSGKVKTDGKLSFEGLITDTSFAFSMNRKKAQQLLTKANINLNYADQKLHLFMENIILDKAIFDGDITGELNLGDDFEWKFSAESEVFSLSDKVQKLYAIKQSPFENLKFKVNGKKRELIDLTLSSNLEKIKTKWGEFRDSKYVLSYSPEKEIYKFDLNSKVFILDSQFLKVDFFDEYKNLNNFSTTLELSKANKSFALVSKTTSPLVSISADGEDYNKTFLANLNIDKTSFVLEGHINSGFKIKSVQ